MLFLLPGPERCFRQGDDCGGGPAVHAAYASGPREEPFRRVRPLTRRRCYGWLLGVAPAKTSACMRLGFGWWVLLLVLDMMAVEWRPSHKIAMRMK